MREQLDALLAFLHFIDLKIAMSALLGVGASTALPAYPFTMIVLPDEALLYLQALCAAGLVAPGTLYIDRLPFPTRKLTSKTAAHSICQQSQLPPPLFLLPLLSLQLLQTILAPTSLVTVGAAVAHQALELTELDVGVGELVGHALQADVVPALLAELGLMFADDHRAAVAGY